MLKRFFLILLLFPTIVSAYSCCLEHGGYDYCSNGKYICKDGTKDSNCICFSEKSNDTEDSEQILKDKEKKLEEKEREL